MIRYGLDMIARQAAEGAGAATGDAGAAAGAAGAGAAAGAAGTGAGAAAGAAAGAGAAAAGAWYDSPDLDLDPEDRTFLAARNPGDLKTAIRSFRETERLARDRNVLPKPDPTKMGEWPGWGDLGWKSDAADYAKSIKRPQVPHDFQYDANFEASFVRKMHEAKVPLPMAQLALDTVIGYAKDAIAATDASGAQAAAALDQALKAEWGGDYDAKKELSQRAARHFGIGLDDGAELERIVGSARMMKIFATIGEQLGEDTLVTPNDGGGSGQMSLSQVQAEMDRQAADPDFMKAFEDPRHPRHKEVRGLRDALISKKAKLGGG